VGGHIGHRTAKAVFPQGFSDIREGQQGGPVRAFVEKGGSLTTIFEKDLDFAVGVAFRMGSDHEEGLPEVVIAFVGKQVLHDLPGADHKPTFVVAKAHVESGIEDRVQTTTQVIPGAPFPSHGAAPTLYDIDAGFDEGSK